MKWAALPRVADYTKSFLKDWKKISHSGRYDMHRLKRLMLLLISNETPLGPEWLDHPLKGSWAGYRECHVGCNFLLIYRIDNQCRNEQVIFVRAGTHAQLFG